ncbi:MAG: serine hydrolase, partial [Algoriphagus sp.]
MTSLLSKFTLSLFVLSFIFSCQQKVSKFEAFQTSIQAQLDSIQGDVAVAFINLSDPSDSLMINADEEFHAASTMKVPVMVELFKQQNQGKLNLSDSILLKNEFR